MERGKRLFSEQGREKIEVERDYFQSKGERERREGTLAVKRKERITFEGESIRCMFDGWKCVQAMKKDFFQHLFAISSNFLVKGRRCWYNDSLLGRDALRERERERMREREEEKNIPFLLQSSFPFLLSPSSE